MRTSPRIVLVSRKFPPAVGGMERVSYQLANALGRRLPVSLVVWGGSQRWLPVFVAAAAVRATAQGRARHATHVHVTDALLAPLGLLLRWLVRARVSATVHGLDITYPNRLYQRVVPRAVARLDRVVCISAATADECLRRGVPAERIAVVPWAVDPADVTSDATRSDLETVVGRPLQGRTVLLTVGRLVRRKGVHWFVESVLPMLPRDVLLVVVGDGAERERIEQAVRRHGLCDRVQLLGRISDADLKVVYSTSDVFVMPNIVVAGDVEGFGMVAAEAHAAGLPVVAADLQGIVTAVDGLSGAELVTAGDARAFAHAVHRAIDDARCGTGAGDRRTARTWDDVADEYCSQVFC